MTEIRVGNEPGFGDPSPLVDPEPERERVDLFAPPSAEETSGRSALQLLEEALAEPAEAVELVRLRVPRRRGVELEFDPSKINSTNRKAWQKRATKRSRRIGQDSEVDDFLFACLVLANTHVGTFMNGVEATDDEGSPLTFAHARLWAAVGARDPQECIQKMYANDQHVSASSGEVLLRSGIDDDLTGADPTEG